MAAFQANRQYDWGQVIDSKNKADLLASVEKRASAPVRLPRITDSYLHILQVQSKFKKHASAVNLLFHTFILLAVVYGLIQSMRAIVSDVVKLSSLFHNQIAVSDLYHKTALENQVLKERITAYSSPSGIEELARNNLEMVGKDEILVRLR